MYARIVTIQMKPGTVDEGVEIYASSIVPAMQEQPGHNRATLLVNRDANSAVSISLWETEAAMQAGEASGYLQAQFARVAPFFAGPPMNEHFEVSVQT